MRKITVEPNKKSLVIAQLLIDKNLDLDRDSKYINKMLLDGRKNKRSITAGNKYSLLLRSIMSLLK